jgi:hypothetical protein
MVILQLDEHGDSLAEIGRFTNSNKNMVEFCGQNEGDSTKKNQEEQKQHMLFQGLTTKHWV